MKRVIFSLIVLSGIVFASGNSANSNTGCGLGSMLFENQNTTLKQILAATTNGTSGNQTFGITSGTSNCEKPSHFVSNEKLQQFVKDNMDSIAMDISKGEGENLDTIASMMGVKDKKAFAKRVQANFDKIYTNENVTSAQVIDAISQFV